MITSFSRVEMLLYCKYKEKIINIKQFENLIKYILLI